MACNGFSLQSSNPKPNNNPTPNEYTYTCTLGLKMSSKNHRARAITLGAHTDINNKRKTHVQYRSFNQIFALDIFEAFPFLFFCFILLKNKRYLKGA